MSSKDPTEEQKVPPGQSDDYHTIDKGGGGQDEIAGPSVSLMNINDDDVEADVNKHGA